MNIPGVWQTKRRPHMSKTTLKIACQRSYYRTLRQVTDMRNLREFLFRMLINPQAAQNTTKLSSFQNGESSIMKLKLAALAALILGRDGSNTCVFGCQRSRD